MVLLSRCLIVAYFSAPLFLHPVFECTFYFIACLRLFCGTPFISLSLSTSVMEGGRGRGEEEILLIHSGGVVRGALRWYSGLYSSCFSILWYASPFLRPHLRPANPLIHWMCHTARKSPQNTFRDVRLCLGVCCSQVFDFSFHFVFVFIGFQFLFRYDLSSCILIASTAPDLKLQQRTNEWQTFLLYKDIKNLFYKNVEIKSSTHKLFLLF